MYFRTLMVDCSRDGLQHTEVTPDGNAEDSLSRTYSEHSGVQRFYTTGASLGHSGYDSAVLGSLNPRPP